MKLDEEGEETQKK